MAKGRSQRLSLVDKVHWVGLAMPRRFVTARIGAVLTPTRSDAEAEAVQRHGIPWALALSALIGTSSAGCVADTAGLEALGALELTPASLAFGILFATVITLILIPALYAILERFKYRFRIGGYQRQGGTTAPVH